MSKLFYLHLSRHVAGMVKGPVKSVPAIGLLFAIDESGNYVVPDRAAIRECLPHYYRKSFDKSALSQLRGKGDIFHFILYSARGKYMNTLYAIGSVFEPEVRHV